MKNKNIRKILIAFLLAGIVVTSFGFMGNDKNGNKRPSPVYKMNSSQESGKQGDAYRMNVNNLNIPFNRKGNIADVEIFNPVTGDNQSGGQFAGHTFLFSAGFFLSGNANGQPWANAVAPSTLVEDYTPGTVASGTNSNTVIYVLNSQDEPFGQSWQDWADAVALGADFYDGDGDGVYNPVDINGNGKWDPDEDRPDLIGDETAWCVYNDGLPSSQRRWNTVSPLGINIKQTIFAFSSAGAIGNLIFLRYRFTYVGGQSPEIYGDPDELTDVYFGVWADPDLGAYQDDAVGSDVPRNAGYTYNPNADDQYANQPPCYMIDFFSGPVVYIPGETFIDNDGDGEYTDGVDTPIDTAHSVKGQVKGIELFPGAKNLPISSFVEYLNGDPDLNDPSNKEEARNYMLGLNRVGDVLDPCTFSHGEVRGGVDCTTVDPLFWFSGDPVTNVGWITTDEEDVRQMTNTGPFTLKRNEEKEIVVAYVVGQGSSPLDAITVARKIDDGAQNIFDLNFLAPSPPPPVTPEITSSDNFIDIVWDTPDAVSYVNTTPTWDLRFHLFNVFAFKTNNTADVVNNEPNSILIGTFQVDNFIKNVYKENAETGGIELFYPEAPAENKLNMQTYTDPATGRIRVRIFNDPFDINTPITKGTPYYFAIVGSAINYDALVFKTDPNQPVGTVGDYYLTAAAFAQEAENPRKIFSIVAGSDLYNPPIDVQPSNKVSGASDGMVGYDVIDIASLKNASYEVSFFKDSSSAQYKMFWQLKNITSNTVLVDTSDAYTYGSSAVDQPVTEGFITRVQEQTARINTNINYDPSDAVWFAPFDSASGTGPMYVGKDLPQGRDVPTFNSKQSDVITADRLRRVEIRFGDQGKAYRYINGYVGPPPFGPRLSYIYAGGVTAADTVGKGVVGKLGEGFVDVPFTAWVVDENYNEEKQLAVGFVERANNSQFPNGNPDGEWDPSDSLLASGEVIVIFDAPYDPAGGQIEYTGGTFSTPGGDVVVWADLLKASSSAGQIPDDAQGITDQQRAVFNSPWFNAMYVVGLQKKDVNSFYTSGDKLTIPVDVYPYTENDVYQFDINGGTITENDERALFDKVNVFPNPLYGFNTLTGFDGTSPDEPFVTFTNLPTDITVRIYSLSGQLLRTLTTADKSEPTSPFLRWDLQNENGLRAASGLYLAIVSSPKFGDKVLKFSIIMPQKQIPRF